MDLANQDILDTAERAIARIQICRAAGDWTELPRAARHLRDLADLLRRL